MVQSYIENYTLKQSKPPIKLQKPTASTESIFRIFSLCCELHLPLLEPLHTHHGAFSRPTELQLVPQPTRLVTNHYIGCIFPLGHHFSLAVLYPKVDFSLSVLPKSQCPAAAYTEPHFRLHIAPPPPLFPLFSRKIHFHFQNSLSFAAERCFHVLCGKAVFPYFPCSTMARIETLPPQTLKGLVLVCTTPNTAMVVHAEPHQYREKGRKIVCSIPLPWKAGKADCV